MNTTNVKTFRVKVNSAFVESLEYDLSRLKLKVKFKKGKSKKRSYSFKDVTPDEFHNILDAKSVGRAVMKLGLAHL